MNTRFSRLNEIPLASGATVMRRTDEAVERVTEDSPALAVMTDFVIVDAVRVPPNGTIDSAYQQMKNSGVRLLFVAGSGDEVLGVITSRDIEGEKPVRFQRDVGVTRADVLVRDIMTPRDNLEVLKFEDVRHSHVGDIVATLRHMGRQHAMVVESAGGGMRVRGLFSTSRIGRQLGMALEVGDLARTFAEIEAVLR